MRKLLLSVAILAVAASCSKNEVTEIPQTNKISFSTLNDRVTKAANEDNADYKVYAVNSAATDKWYINDYVSCGASEDALAAASGITYNWPTGANESLTFNAYAPKGSANITDASAAGVVSLSYVVPANADEDFTIATELSGKTSNSYTDDVVPFEFQHMLSKVTVSVVLEEEFAKAHTLDADSYTFDLLLAENAWSTAGGYAAAATKAEVAYTSATHGAYYNVLPQTFIEGCNISIDNVTVTNTSSEVAVFNDVSLTPISLYGITSLPGLEAGKKYNFTITVGADATPDDDSPELEIIKFSATTADWTSADDTALTQE